MPRAPGKYTIMIVCQSEIQEENRRDERTRGNVPRVPELSLCRPRASGTVRAGAQPPAPRRGWRNNAMMSSPSRSRCCAVVRRRRLSKRTRAMLLIPRAGTPAADPCGRKQKSVSADAAHAARQEAATMSVIKCPGLGAAGDGKQPTHDRLPGLLGLE